MPNDANTQAGKPTLYLVTGNPNKLRELIAIAPADLSFDTRDLDIAEIQSLDQYEIVRDKLVKAYAVVKSPVMLEDVSAELASLNGLPGRLIKLSNSLSSNSAAGPCTNFLKSRTTGWSSVAWPVIMMATRCILAKA